MFTSASFARSVKTSRLLACALVWSVDGSLQAARQLEALGRQVARAGDERLQPRLAPARARELRAQAVARHLQLALDVAARRVELGGDLVLEQRLVVLLRRRQAAGAEEVGVGRAQLGALERLARLEAVGRGAHRLRGTRPPRGRSPPAAPRAGRCAARRTRRRPPPARRAPARRAAGRRPGAPAYRDDRPPDLMTSTPRGILNSNCLSDSRTFSWRLRNVKVDVPPWLSAATSCRIWSDRWSTTSSSQS